MPTTREQREAKWLQSVGKDPAQFQVDPTSGKVVPRQIDTPTPKPNPTGWMETFGRSAIGAIPETVGGFVGMGAGGALGGAMVPAGATAGGPLAIGLPFIGAAGGGFGGAALAHKLEDEFAPQGYKDFVSKGSQENPMAAEIGAIVPQLLGSNPLKSLRSIRGLLKATPTATRFTSEQVGKIAGIGGGAGIGAGSAVVEDYGKPGGMDMDTARKALIRGVAGVAMSEPNRLGNTFAGGGLMKPTPEMGDRWAGAGRVARDAMQQEGRIPTVEGETYPGTKDADVVDADVIPPRGLLEDAPRGLPPSKLGISEPPPNQVGTQQQTDDVMARAAEDLLRAQQQQNIPPKVDPRYAREPVVPPVQDQPPVPPREDPNFTLPNRPLNESPQQGQLPEPEFVPPSQTEGMSEQDYLRAKKGGVRSGIPIERQQPQEQGNVLGLTSPEWDELIKGVGQEGYKSDVETGKVGLKSDSGIPVAGRAQLPTDLEKGLVQIAKNAGVDTGPHELLHVLANDVLERGTKGEKSFMQRILKGLGGEEQAVQGSAQEFTKRLIDEGGGVEPSLLKDLTSFVKARYLRNATPADYKRILANTLRHGAGSEQYRPGELRSQAKPPVLEGENSPKKPGSRNQELDKPIPETPETLQKQLEITASPEGKAVTLLVHNSPAVPIPSGLRSVDVPQGKAVYNPAKITEAEVIKAGQGEQFDGRVLGMSSEVKPKTYYHVTTDEDSLRSGNYITKKATPFNRKGFHVFDNREDAEFVLGNRKEDGYNNAKILEVTIPEHEIVPDNESLGRAYIAKQFKPEYLTQHVVTTSKEGVKDVITEAVAPGGESAAKDVQQRAVPGGETEVRPAEDVLWERTQPLGPRETYKGKEPKESTWNKIKSKIPTVWSGPAQKLLASKDPLRQQSGDLFNRMYSNRDALRGKYGSVIRQGVKDPKLFREAYEVWLKDSKTGKLTTVRPELRPFLQAQRDTYKQMRLDQNAAGHLINGRLGGVDPTGAFNVPSSEWVKKLHTLDKNSDEYKFFKREHIAENRNRGYTPEAAEKLFNKYIEDISASGDPANAVDFGAVSRAEGGKLPYSAIEPDPIVAWEKYIDRFTTARTWHDAVEKVPAMKRLFEGETSLSRDPDVVDAFNDFKGSQAGGLPEAIRIAQRGLYTGIMGTATRTIDMATTPFKILAHTPVKHMPEVIGEMLQPGKYVEASYQSGLNKPAGNSFAKERAEIGVDATGILNAAIKKAAEYQGANKLEFIARVFAQAGGQTLARLQKIDALAGDKSAQRFLNKSGTDWNKVSPEEAGGRIGHLAQGHEGGRNTPKFAREGMPSAFFTLSKWNIEQWNNFVQHAIIPAVNHNEFGPLFRHIAVGLLGGAAVIELKQLLNNKKPYVASIEEIKNAPHKKGAIIAKLGQFAEATSTIGYVGSMINNLLIKTTTGQLHNEAFTSALAEATNDSATRIVSALNAMFSGADISDVTTMLLKDLLQRNIQLYSIAMSHSKDTEVRNMVRDYKVYRELHGKKNTTPVSNIDYSRSSEHILDRMDAKEGLVKRKEINAEAEKKFAGDRKGFRQEMEKYDTSRQGFFPSDRKEQDEYKAWLEKTQGKEKATQVKQAWRDWEKRERGKETRAVR